MSEEGFSLRRVAREVVEEYPNSTSEQIVNTIMARIKTPEVWEALRQALTPIVEAAFREREAQLSPYVATPVTTELLASLMSYPSAPATTDRGDSDHQTSDHQRAPVSVTPSPLGGGDHQHTALQADLVTAASSTSGDQQPPVSHTASVAVSDSDGGGHPMGETHRVSAAPVRRRTKTTLVRAAAKSWMEQSIRTGTNKYVPIGAATFEDLMAATAGRRRSAYQAMAKADTLERLAKLLQSHGVATVSELPPRILDAFSRSNPELS